MLRKGTTPSEACAIIIELVKSLDENRSSELEQYSLKYTSYVRTMVGAILEYLGRSTDAVLAASQSKKDGGPSWHVDQCVFRSTPESEYILLS